MILEMRRRTERRFWSSGKDVNETVIKVALSVIKSVSRRTGQTDPPYEIIQRCRYSSCCKPL